MTAYGDPPVTAEADAGSDASGRARVSVLAMFALLGLVALQLLRQPTIRGWDGLWQEDGTRFLTGAVQLPLHEALITTYNGYLHVVPRLLAAVAVQFPVSWFAVVMTLQAAVLVALLALHLYVRLEVLLPRPALRALAAAFFVLAPATAVETNANVTNLHWYLAVGAFAALLPGSRRPAGHAVDVAVVLLATLSDPLCGLWLPVAYVRWRQSSGWRDRMAPVTLLLGLVVQALAIVTQRSPDAYTDVQLGQLPQAYALRVGGSFLVGDRWLVSAYQHLQTVLTVALALGLVVLVALALRAAGPRRAVVAGAVGYSILWFCLPVLLRGTTFLVAMRSLNGARYHLIPVLALALALLVAVQGSGTRSSPRRRAATGALVALLVGMTVLNLTTPSARSPGPSWREGVVAARQLCQGLPVDPASNVRRLASGEVTIPVAPRVAPGRRAPWYVVTACERLER